MSSSEIKALVAALQEANTAGNEAGVTENLEKLRDQVKPSEEILRETKAGVAVGKLRTHSNSSIATLAKSIVKAWKEVVDENKKRKAADGDGSSSKKKVKSEKVGESNSNTPTRSASPSSTSKDSSKPSSSTNTKDSRTIASLPSSFKSSSSTTKAKKEKGDPSTSSSSSADNTFPTIVSPYPEVLRTWKTDKAPHPGLGDDIRDKCVMLVYDALAGDSNASKDVIMEKSKAVERGFYNKNDNSTDNTYRQKMRGICMNLKDRTNPGLRDAVVQGSIKGGEICNLSKEDIASSTLQALNKRLEKDNLFNSRGAEQIAAETDQFKCGKCGFRKSTYYQMQTRSADEPMTTFVTCLNCNNRWKFS